MNRQKLQQPVFNLFLIFLFSTFANAQSKIVPIIEMKVGGLLGGVQNGKYLSPKATIEKLSAEQNYTLYLLNGKSESLKLKKPLYPEYESECPDFYGLPRFSGKSIDEPLTDAENEESAKIWEKGGVALGNGFKWNPQPRQIKPIGLNNAEYKKIVADFLRTKKIGKHEVTLRQAVRVDLDGDGIEEVLLAASQYFPYTEKDGKKKFDEYSVVLLRKIINGKPQTILVVGEIYPKHIDDYDGNIFGLSSILDLNGDGKLELVVYSEYYEGNATQVFEIVGNKAVEVKTLFAACGV